MFRGCGAFFGQGVGQAKKEMWERLGGVLLNATEVRAAPHSVQVFHHHQHSQRSMPNTTGALVKQRIILWFPQLRVFLFTAKGSEDALPQALPRGAIIDPEWIVDSAERNRLLNLSQYVTRPPRPPQRVRARVRALCAGLRAHVRLQRAHEPRNVHQLRAWHICPAHMIRDGDDYPACPSPLLACRPCQICDCCRRVCSRSYATIVGTTLGSVMCGCRSLLFSHSDPPDL